MISSIIGLILVGITIAVLVGLLGFMWYVAITTKDKVIISVTTFLTVIIVLFIAGSVFNYFGL